MRITDAHDRTESPNLLLVRVRTDERISCVGEALRPTARKPLRAYLAAAANCWPSLMSMAADRPPLNLRRL